jgi:hypothetical protein
MMQIFNILPAPDGGWKAMLVGDDELVVSYGDKDELIDTMAKWAEVSGDPITLRIHTQEGSLEEERTYPQEDAVDQ